MPSEILQSSLVIVGLGRAGRALARSWISAGGRLLEVVGRDRPSAERVAREFPGARARGFEEFSSPCDLLVLAVPDDLLAPAARGLADRARCRTAFHLSGALSSDVLGPLRDAGAAVGSIHPLRAFTGAASETWDGAFVAIEADPAVAQTAAAFVAAVGGRGHPLSKEGKALYHAAATLAAGGSVGILSVAERVWVLAGLPEAEARRALGELSVRAVSAAGARPFEDAFTGPVARRDLGTVRAHRDALSGQPEALQLYRLLAEECLRRTSGRGKEEEIRRLLSG